MNEKSRDEQSPLWYRDPTGDAAARNIDSQRFKRRRRRKRPPAAPKTEEGK